MEDLYQSAASQQTQQAQQPQQPQQPAYAQQPQQPPFPPRPDNYLVWAILSTLCCCLPFGIVSIVYSAKVNGLYAGGQYDAARQAAANAKQWAIIAAAVGVAINIIYAVWYVIVGASMLTSSL